MKYKLPELSEHQIMQQCISYLEAKNFYVQRQNAGKYSVGEGIQKRFIHGAKIGTPDIFAFNRCVCCLENKGTHVLFIEVKKKGNKPTEWQKIRMQELESFGAKCFVIHSLEELQSVIK